MKTFKLYAATGLIFFMCLFTACKGKEGKEGDYPREFDTETANEQQLQDTVIGNKPDSSSSPAGNPELGKPIGKDNK